MRDTPNKLPESRAYFKKFLSAMMPDYMDVYRALGNPSKSGYGRYKNDNNMSQHLTSLVMHLNETFQDVSIPEVFSSEKLLAIEWKKFYDYILTQDELIAKTKDTFTEMPEPFIMILKIHDSIKACLEAILDMSEVQDVLIGKSVSNQQSNVEVGDQADVVIITALHDTEFEAFVELLPSFTDMESVDTTHYIRGNIDGRKVIVATDDKMGMAAATALTLKMLTLFRPNYIIMGGIAAGVKSEERNFGDVLVARHTFNYESGKYQFKRKLKQTVFEPNPEPIELDGTFTSVINRLKVDKARMATIHKVFNATRNNKKPEDVFAVHFGPIASGSAVLADDKKVEDIKAHSRKLIGIDMETFGVYYGCQSFRSVHQCKAISIKSISDFADKMKNDGYRNYAAHTSASFIIELIKGL
ncbi:5'-methylthioadenosine/S-adenosylhomocysteine nucleosidase family protein [Sphingobacterium daejeonense]|uniref:5'-methylthioadenosine/S-adenosylhomocysteine nucleosidase family protein n=1 Tax=Sphingobacterium daejeonense TaxID=371142 RepID=UPI0010C31C46|nr:5'-methylthioadenosine/S-adenosylhomocysteine nucleosidase [Sphingobacterium daejeonense]VTP87333.1 5'-methylthioadenosine/S-adenosylhomocysteine nucleosidase [Sphingobacterium daejeonense]